MFARYGRESEIARICGLVQALRGSILYHPTPLVAGMTHIHTSPNTKTGPGTASAPSHGNGDETGTSLGEIQSIQTNSSLLVFSHVGAMTLVAVVASLDGKNKGKTTRTTRTAVAAVEAQVRLQLEYLYSQLVFRFTDQIQQAFAHNTSFDVQSLLVGTDEGWIHAILNDSFLDTTTPSTAEIRPNDNQHHPLHEEQQHTRVPLFLCANPSLAPLSTATRRRISHVLQQIGQQTENTLFAILFVDTQLVCLVQPDYGPHLMRCTDLHMLLHFIGQRRERFYSDLWLPVCLPRLHSSGFLHCYTRCLHRLSTGNGNDGLLLALLSPLGTTAQFEAFRQAANNVAQQLELPSSCAGDNINTETRHNHLVSPRSQEIEDDDEEAVNSDDDYVDASGEGDQMIPYASISSTTATPCSILVEELETAMDPIASEKMYRSLLDTLDPHAIHFCYRYNAPVRTNPQQRTPKLGSPRPRRRRHQEPAPIIGYLTQCLSSSMTSGTNHDTTTTTTPIGLHFLWSMYHKLSLRLRLGSASNESVHDAMTMIARETKQDHDKDNPPPGVGRYCPMTGLFESSPNFTGMAMEYHAIKENDHNDSHDEGITYFGMNGAEFELYYACRGKLQTQQAARAGARLVRRLQSQQDALFQTHPPTWIEH